MLVATLVSHEDSCLRRMASICRGQRIGVIGCQSPCQVLIFPREKSAPVSNNSSPKTGALPPHRIQVHYIGLDISRLSVGEM